MLMDVSLLICVVYRSSPCTFYPMRLYIYQADGLVRCSTSPVRSPLIKLPSVMDTREAMRRWVTNQSNLTFTLCVLYPSTTNDMSIGHGHGV